MKVNNIKDLTKFLEAVNQCEGDVFMISKAGDKLNLKSQLCKYVALAELCKDVMIEELTIQCDNPADAQKLLQYMINRKE